MRSTSSSFCLRTWIKSFMSAPASCLGTADSRAYAGKGDSLAWTRRLRYGLRENLGSTLRSVCMPKHRCAAGLASSSPLFPSCLPRAAECYAAPVFVSSIL
jgi:hypothetical protein